MGITGNVQLPNPSCVVSSILYGPNSEIQGNVVLPDKSDVKKNIVYGSPNNVSTGSMDIYIGTLDWSDEMGSMDWNTASTTCDNWGGRLPTIGELFYEIDNHINNPDNPFKNGIYWSSTEGVIGKHWITRGDSLDNWSESFDITQHSVRCVQ